LRQILPILAVGALLTGCASVEPLTFDEALHTERATRNDVRDWEEELRYRVELQYANTARQKLESVDLDIPPNTNIDLVVPFAIWDYARGDNLSGNLTVAAWINSGLTKESRYRTYYNRGLGYMLHPNTHYFTFDERDGVATPADVHEAWDEAHALFQSVFNRAGNCRVFGYTEEYQYARTYPKNVPGKYKDVLYLCSPHPLFADKEQKVMVTAYANPFDGVRVIAGVVTQCWVQPPRGQSFLDLRGCGLTLADAQRTRIPESRFSWVELVTTPRADAPFQSEVVVRRGDQVTTLPAPEMTEKYQAFLKERPYPE
jgi:hypothetical protein